MKVLIRIITVLLSVICLLSLYMTIGYISRCINGAYLIGENQNAHFVGYYMMAAPCFLIFLISGFFSVFLIIKNIKKN